MPRAAAFLVAALNAWGSSSSVLETLYRFANLAGVGILSMYFGVLSVAVGLMTSNRGVPLSPHLDAWYTPSSLLSVAIVLVLALWCFHYALGERRVLKGNFLDG